MRRISDKYKKTLNELKDNEELFKKVIRIAQRESEIDMGVNPSDNEQADTGKLTKKDFEYIRKVCALVELKLQNAEWLEQTLENIDKRSGSKHSKIAGIRFDDELFKAGRGVLQSYLDEK
jgi:hypothetical protein